MKWQLIRVNPVTQCHSRVEVGTIFHFPAFYPIFHAMLARTTDPNRFFPATLSRDTISLFAGPRVLRALQRYIYIYIWKMALPRGTADTTYASTIGRSSLFSRHVAVCDVTLRGVGVTQSRGSRRWTEMTIYYVIILVMSAEWKAALARDKSRYWRKWRLSSRINSIKKLRII